MLLKAPIKQSLLVILVSAGSTQPFGCKTTTTNGQSDSKRERTVQSLQADQVTKDRHNHLWKEPITGMEFLHVQAGSFMMGMPPGEIGQKRMALYHPVKLTRDFYLGKYEVTQSQWRRIMDTNPSHFEDYGDNTKGKFVSRPTPVGSYLPNPWGFYDMHGNVWEWCLDSFCEYPADLVVDPLGDCNSGKQVIRGGSWYFNAENARSGRRYTHSPEDRGFSLGFRLVREAP